MRKPKSQRKAVENSPQRLTLAQEGLYEGLLRHRAHGHGNAESDFM